MQDDKPAPNSVLKEMVFDFDAEGAEKEIIPLLQELRTNPKSFIKHLQARLDTFQGNFYVSCNKKIRSREGPKPVEEAMAWLDTLEPLPAFDVSKEALFTAAKVHCEDLCKNGTHGHKGKDGSSLATRVGRYGKWKGGVSENIALQQQTPLDVVLHWLIDDGGKARKHRQNLMDGRYRCIGLACGVHKKYKSCAVLVFAHNVLKGTGKEAIHLKSEYEKSGFDQFGVDNKVFNYKDMQKNLVQDMRGDLNKDWIPGAVSLRTVKEIIKEEGGEEKTIVKYIYTMGDGSIREVVSEFDEVVENRKDDVAHEEQYVDEGDHHLEDH